MNIRNDEIVEEEIGWSRVRIGIPSACWASAFATTAGISGIAFLPTFSDDTLNGCGFVRNSKWGLACRASHCGSSMKKGMCGSSRRSAAPDNTRPMNVYAEKRLPKLEAHQLRGYVL